MDFVSRSEAFTRIFIIGAGNVGAALALALTRRGQSVVLGVPEPGRCVERIAALGPLARLATTAQAIAASDLVILAVPCAAVPSIAPGVADWAGKILVDASNPLALGLKGLSLGTATSGAETLAALAPGARVVMASNSTGAENMADAA